ncbi:hypothetical protein [Armatimonas sp.]|uniref:glycine-rich domain-containing protein n=1 Tax=Armatimonas sp. TaxID=1872638 RepID=UPI00286A9B1C|nr:hypothetical protein [Armatimonas sp.]
MRNNNNHYQQNPLWQQLAALPLEEGFSKRLARENEWGVLFTEQVIGEYRRFLYLTQVAGHAVTPSKAVDEAWHLHLLYTRSYWEALCGDILSKPLHHEPGTGKPKDEVHFAGQYAKTQESYQRIFGEEPPSCVWGTKKPQKAVSLGRKRALGWLATGLGSVALAGASGNPAAGILILALIFGVIILVVILSASDKRRNTRRGTHGDSGGSCGGLFIASSCSSSDSGDSGGGDSGGGGDAGGGDGGGSSCGSSCGGGGGGD